MKKAVKQSEHHNFPNKTNETKIDWLYTKCWGKERAYKINLKNFQKK